MLRLGSGALGGPALQGQVCGGTDSDYGSHAHELYVRSRASYDKQ